MTTEIQPAPVTEPVFDVENPGASLGRINKLVLPVRYSLFRGERFGDYPSRIMGRGSEFDGVRDYVAGDSPKDVDWIQTARAAQEPGRITTLKVRDRYQDVIPGVWVVTDTTKEQNTSNPGYFTKQDLALSAIAAITLLAKKEGAPIALVAANEHTLAQSTRRPVKGRHNTQRISRQLAALAEDSRLSTEAEDRIRLNDLLNRVAQCATRNVVVVVSDFLDTTDPKDPDNGWELSLQSLKSRKNQIIAVRVNSPWDFVMPEQVERFHGEGKVEDIGSGKRARAVREAFQQVVAPKQHKAIDQALIHADAAHIKLSTDNPLWFSSFRSQLRDIRGRK